MNGSAGNKGWFRRLVASLTGRAPVPPPQPVRPRIGGFEAVADALAELRAAQGWPDIPPLTNYLAHRNPEVRNETAVVLETLVPAIPAHALPGFEAGLRRDTLKTYTWTQLTVQDVATRDWPPALWALFTMHPSGYLREAAILRLLSSGQPGAYLPFLLLRLNDWVEQVRATAERAVRPFLSLERLPLWVPALPLLASLQARSRADHSWLLDDLTRLFLLPAAREVLRQAARSRNFRVARWALQTSLLLPEQERGEFLDITLASADPVARLRAATHIKDNTDVPRRAELLARILADPAVPVRRQGLYAMLDTPPAERRTYLRSALLDNHATIRHAARVYLREQDNEFDARRFYLDVLAAGDAATLGAAVGGVGDCGQPEDAARLIPFTGSNRKSVAVAAVRAVAKLDRNGHAAMFEDALGDPRPAVAREAARSLSALGYAISPERLRDIMRNGAHTHTRKMALFLLLQRSPYDAVVDAIQSAVSSDPVVAGVARSYLARFPRQLYLPTDAQMEAIWDAVARVEYELPADVLARVVEIMYFTKSH